MLSKDAVAQGDMVCPRCGGGTLAQKNGFWGCSRFREGCAFTVSGTVAGKQISEAQVKQLVLKRRTKLLKGFKSKAGKSFDAMLVLGPDWKVGFEFEK